MNNNEFTNVTNKKNPFITKGFYLFINVILQLNNFFFVRNNQGSDNTNS